MIYMYSKDINDLIQRVNHYQVLDEIDKRIKNNILDFLNRYNNPLSRDNPVGHITVSAWIINEDHSKVLMINHNLFHSWGYIGGHLDDNPNIIEVIKREIKEETGLSNYKLVSDDILNMEINAVQRHIKNNKLVLSHLHFDIEYLFMANESDKIRIKEDENSGVRWININDIDKYVTEEHMLPLYQKLINKSKKYIK